MTIIPDRFDKIGSVLREMRSNLGTAKAFTTREVYALYVQRYPGDVQIMEDRKVVKPTAHDLEGYLNGEIVIYSNKTDGSEADRPAIERLDVKTYRFVSNLISNNSLSKEGASISHRSSGEYLPNKDDFESACRMISPSGTEVPIDSVLDQIEINATNSGYNLKINWRLITERNIGIWVKTK